MRWKAMSCNVRLHRSVCMYVRMYACKKVWMKVRVCVCVCVRVCMLCAYACVYLWNSVKTCKKTVCVVPRYLMRAVCTVHGICNACNTCKQCM